MKSITQLTKKLIEFQSVTGDNKQCNKLLDYVEAYLKPAGVHIERFTSEGFPSMVAGSQPGKHFKYLFVGHIDVVPAEEHQFLPKQEGDKLFGRGAKDMKGQCAVMIELLKHFPKHESLAIMLTPDEEKGGEKGVEYLLRKGYTCDFFIAPDGGNDFTLITKEKGTLWLEVKVKGKAAHGSTPWEGENAIEKLMGQLNKIKTLFEKDNINKWVTTLNISQIQGGSAPNQVPEEATALLDIRWTKDAEQLKDKIADLVDEYNIKQFGALFNTNENHPELLKFKQAVKQVLGRKPVLGFEHGASDARHFTPRGMQGLIVNPVGGGVHGKEEWVSLKSLEQLYRIFEKFIG